MKKPNVLAGSIFGLIAISTFFFGSMLVASTYAMLSAGFLLSEVASIVPSSAQLAAAPVPVWRRNSSTFLFSVAVSLMVISIGLIGYQVGQDFRAKVANTDATKTTRLR